MVLEDLRAQFGPPAVGLHPVLGRLIGSGDDGPYGTTVVLPAGYVSDLGRVDGFKYIEPMALVLLMVVLAFGLLYVAVVAEERQMQEATKPRKR